METAAKASLVALRKESVDRNLQMAVYKQCITGSLSARRAWIEIVAACPFSCCGTVALRKESVDRNTENAVLFLMTKRSLSARRAWIEIF